MTTTGIVLIVCLVGLLALAALAVSSRRSRLRREDLRRRFGPEYDRALEEHGSATRAERALAERAKRVDRFHFRELNQDDRKRFANTWSDIQSHFIDDPSRAVREANVLIKEVMTALGYPSNDFEQRVADLSVHHATVVQHYRAAHALAESNLQGQVDTEELRQAVVHYRSLFAALIDGTSTTNAQSLREVHA